VPRILVADDDPISLRYLGDALRALGATVDTEVDGARALERALATGYDALVLDLRLPGLDGATLLARLRADPAAASCVARAYVQSGELDARSRRRLIDAGFADAWQKPVALAALQAAFAPAGVAEAAMDRVDAAAGDADLDDAAGVLAAGSPDALSGLRDLLLAELPTQLAALQAALAGGDLAGAAEIAHRLHGGCRFCGAPRLAHELDRLQRALEQEPVANASFAAGVYAAAADLTASLRG
jgi:CheY-like chemotaxis protein